MKLEVAIKDRKAEIEYVRMALVMCEFNIEYQHADLIIKVIEALKQKQGKFSMLDGVDIHYNWKQHWKNYFAEQAKQKTEPTGTLIRDFIIKYRDVMSARLRNILERPNDTYKTTNDVTYIEELTKKRFLDIQRAGNKSWTEFQDILNPEM